MNFFNTIKSNYFWWGDNNWIKKAKIENKDLVEVVENGSLRSNQSDIIRDLQESNENLKELVKGLNEELQQVVKEYDLKLSEANTKLEQLTREYNRLYTEHQGLEEDQKLLCSAMEALHAKQLGQKENVYHK